ncbi:DUF1501 domain-containing protein, partial [Verrucomicrobia bacterium]|nr:DUF1501 domain-containing protein [Verrucomicrobiota bacterium]
MKARIINSLDHTPQAVLNRRTFLGHGVNGLGAMALASLSPHLSAEKPGTSSALNGLHIPAKAKRVIFICQSGGVSQFETFDYKPKLEALNGKPMPPSLTDGQRLAQIRGKELIVQGSPYRFRKQGKSGAEISELLPFTSKIVDDICIVKTCVSEAINHDPAVTFLQCGNQQPGRPTMGAWLSYGLGSENSDLPTFVVLASGMNQGQNLHTRYWGSGFLPSEHQGVRFRPAHDAVPFVNNPAGVDRNARGRVIDSITAMNNLKDSRVFDPEISARIKAYEMAFRMQASVPELMDISGEPDHVLKLYGPEVSKPGSAAANCLLARRLA